MADRLRDDPVLVLGMHHSGTSILAQVLHHNGVFMHANMAHHESRFFTKRVNDRLIMGGDGAWARLPIMPVDAVMAKLEKARSVIRRNALEKYVAAGYDGRSRWGFKDPRTCVLLPLYLELFPNAQLLHIVRDEDAVADSIARGAKEGVGRVEDREYWKELRRQYVARARDHGRRHQHYEELAYEDLCASPVEVMRPIFAYLGLPCTVEVQGYVREHVRALGAAAP